MRTLPEAETRQVAASLKRWAERPIRPANLRAAGVWLATIAFAAIAAAQSPDPASAMRGMAILFAAFQSVVHLVMTGMLRILASLGVAEATAALASYRDPRRISGMDLVAMWLAVALAAPFWGS